MLSKLKTSAILGINAIPVEVEAKISSFGLPKFTIIGLGDATVRESKDRVIAAIKLSGFELSETPILVNLAPAEIKKEGSSFDLPIAIALLAASGQVNTEGLKRLSIHGELALDGKVKPIKGVVAMTIAALQDGAETILVPIENVREGRLVKGIRVLGVTSLVEAAQFINGKAELATSIPDEQEVKQSYRSIYDVWGQESAKRAMLIAASGGHNLLMIGPPGCGKSMLAERFGGLLPPLLPEEILETVKIHSIAGLPVRGLLGGDRPYRNPHHVISDAGLVGGGANPRPGEISLAHNGVLFLDELPEYRRSALESMRAPLESGGVRIARARGSLNFPARFQLIAAMNPCPCGRLGINGMQCGCSVYNIRHYLRKLSQPILDRIDLHVELQAVPFSELSQPTPKGQLPDPRELVLLARERQYARNSGMLNARLESHHLLRNISLDAGALGILEKASRLYGFSARTYVRILKVAQTIADLNGDLAVLSAHIAEAISYRSLERLYNCYQSVSGSLGSGNNGDPQAIHRN